MAKAIPHHVWVWGNEGKKILYRGPSKMSCVRFKRNYHGYPQNEIYISRNTDD